MQIALFGIHVFAEVLEIVERIDLGRTVVALIDKEYLVFAETLHINEVGIVRCKEHLRMGRGVHQIYDKVRKTDVKLPVELIKHQRFAVTNDVDKAQYNMEQTLGAFGFLGIHIKLQLRVLLMVGLKDRFFGRQKGDGGFTIWLHNLYGL